MSHKNALSQYESGLCPASYDISLRGLSARQLLRHTTTERAIQYLIKSEEPLKSMPTSQEN